MQAAGYVPDSELVLHEVGYCKKEYVLCGHTEKLAVGFGLIATAFGTPLKITKNFRLCPDCH